MAEPGERAFATEVVARLAKAGHEALFAGGCVRDEILGLEPDDYDVASSATPDQVVSPAWHRDELSRRREQLEQGSSSFQSWNDAMTGLKAELRGYQAP